MQADCLYLQDILHRDIPLTRHMELRVARWEDHELRLAMPLAPNINHTGTMFGGSLYGITVLTGWGWLTLRLREAGISDGHIVIRGGQIEYPRPVSGDAESVCGAPADEDWQKFLTQYQRRGRARLHLEIRIPDAEGQDCVRLHGEYVLVKDSAA
jgi:thioesterase domain-containing protein